jgi:5-methyltetrahydropteroyltriglutamate--homocysteine methyltransferase
VLIGVIDVASDALETPQEVAKVIAAAAKYVAPRRLFPCTNCGMAPMDRELALKKLQALVAGTALARKKFK